MLFHGTLLFLQLVILHTWAGYQPLTILNQSNAYELFFDLSNHIECDNYTDYFARPVLQAADDFVLPPYTSLDTMHRQSSDCNALQFTFVTLRSRQDQDPESITLQLFYNQASPDGNGTLDAPQDQPFFSRTWCAPNATSCQWDIHLTTPLNTTLTLNNGDMADDGVTRFDLSNLSLIPVGRRLWVSFFATVPRHYARNILRSNTLYWMTLNNRSGSTPVQDPLDAQQGLVNAHYHYRDALNTRYNATQWTDATVIQPLLGVHTTTYNMAWRAALICDYLEPVPPLPPNTEYPTWAPTRAPVAPPTAQPSGTNPTATPSVEPTTGSPTGASSPSPLNRDNTTTMTPSSSPTSGNTTDWMHRYLADRQTQIIVYCVIGSLILFALCCLCLYCWRKKRCCFRKGSISVTDYLYRAKTGGYVVMNDNAGGGGGGDHEDIEMRDMHTGDTNHTNPLHHGDEPRYQRTPFSADPRDRSSKGVSTGVSEKYSAMFGGDLYTQVDLSEGSAIDGGGGAKETRGWLNEMAPTQPVVSPTVTAGPINYSGREGKKNQ